MKPKTDFIFRRQLWYSFWKIKVGAKAVMKEIAKYTGCFVCGDNNEFGLKAKFYYKDGKAISECIARKHYEGYHNVYHGGITSTLLDEVMIKALLAQGIYVVTAEMTVKFHKMVEIGQKLLFEGKLERQKGRLYFTSGEAKTPEGKVVASATGKYLKVNEETREMLIESLER
jgi:uncharacterized protein (TIGR00369 family)